jgi:Na+/proline symporter
MRQAPDVIAITGVLMNGVLLAILAYVAIQFAIGAYVSRNISTATDYIVAGRSLGVPLITFAVFGTFFGSEALTATTASVYDAGLSGAFVDPFAYALGMVLAGMLVAARLRGQELVTFADFFRTRYAPSVEKLVVLVLLPGSLFWAAAQIRVFGVVLTSNAGIALPQAIMIAALVVGIYAVVGGLLADSVTDFLHGIVIMVGLLALALVVMAALGAAGGSLAAVPPERLVPYDREASLLRTLERLAVPICGTIVAVELISRYLGAKTPAAAATGTALGGIVYLVFGLIPVYLGLAAAQLIPGVKETEEIVPRLASAYLTPALYVVFVGAIISAILSTVHATLHAPAAQVAHNLIVPLSPDLSERTQLWTTRATVAVLAVVAYALAASSEGIKDLVETASAFGSAGVFVTLMFGLFTRSGGASSAIAAIAAGVVAWALGRYAFAMETPYLLALLLSTIAYVGVALMERRTLAA